MKVVVLTGAGVSAESGVPTFRDDDGLWHGHRVENVATPHAFRRDPALVHRFYDDRRAALATVQPNVAHRALAQLGEVLGDDLLVVTQNIDDLHERAGSRSVLHMHGEIFSARCLACGLIVPWRGNLGDEPPCPACAVSLLRPNVVWFGEVPFGMDQVRGALEECDLFVSIGTSGAVHPAAGFVREAALHGARTLELNLKRSEGSHFFDETRLGPAGTLVPAWVAQVLA